MAIIQPGQEVKMAMKMKIYMNEITTISIDGSRDEKVVRVYVADLYTAVNISCSYYNRGKPNFCNWNAFSGRYAH